MLSPRSAFSNTTTAGNDVPNEIPNSQLDIIPNMPYVSDPNLNKYAINADQYPRMTALLAGFMRGSRVKVTYFRQTQQGSSNVRTNLADYSTERNVLTSEFEQIDNFEITLQGGFKFSFDTSNVTADVSGTALFYAGLEPVNGDFFLYSASNGKYGLYRITNVNPMNWTNDRVYMVDFSLQSFPDSSDVSGLIGAVIRKLVWTKQVTYGQCYSVISSQAYLLLQKISVFRSELSRYYHRTFYDRDLHSYIRPDQIYDPCCVEFVLGKITTDDVPIRAKQLYHMTDDLYGKSLWGRIDDRYITTLNGISSGYTYDIVSADSLSSFVNELFGYTVILPQDYLPVGARALPSMDPRSGELLTPLTSSESVYVFSENFWSGNIPQMTDLEKSVYTLITTRAIDGPAATAGDIMQNAYQLDVNQQYYVIPYYIHLIDLLIQYVPLDLDSPQF